MDEDDEEVVFTNTALYEHLVSSGFSDFESASCLQQAVSQSTELAEQSQMKVSGVGERLVGLLDRLGLWSGRLLVPAALDSLLGSGLMGDRDRAMAADLCRSDESQADIAQAASGSFLLSLFVAGVAVAVWLPAACLPLSAALVSLSGGAAVARWRVAAGRRCVAEFCRTAGALRRTGLRCCRLLQESHLMARGVTLSSGDAGAEAAFSAQYGELVQAAGAGLRAACHAYGRATRRLRRERPLLEGVDPARHYLACDETALAGFSGESFTVKDIKSLQQLLVDCQSEFVRRLCLGLSGALLPPDAGRSVPLPLLAGLSASLSELERRLSAAHRAHAALWAAEPEPEPGRSAAPPAGGLQRLYVGVHSVCLQAQVVALRARTLEQALGDRDGDGERTESDEAELYTTLRRELTEIQRRLDSGQLFCEQTLLQLDRLEGGGGPESPQGESPPAPPPPTAAPVPLLSDLPQPELQDQFFEAVVEGETGPGGDSEDELLSREERLRRRLERDRARELLGELNVALTGKRHEWRVREAMAKGEPVPPAPPPPPPPPARSRADLQSDGGDPYKINKADLYDFSGSEEEIERVSLGGELPRRPDLPDGYRVDKRDLYRFSDSEDEPGPAAPLVLPPAGDLRHLLPVQRRARPPARRPPSRPGSVAGTPRPAAGQGRGSADSAAGLSPPVTDSEISPSEPCSVVSLISSPSDPSLASSTPDPNTPAVASDSPTTPASPPPPLTGSARYRAAALGLPSRQGFPAEMAAQAAALALKRRQRSQETFGDDSEGEDGDG